MDVTKEMQMPDAQMASRKRTMQFLAQATTAELRGLWETILPQPDVLPVRGPETGLVMVRGRIGGGGDPFNLGEATVTRATIRLETGEIGHGQMLGTDKERARLAAIFDALLQVPQHRGAVEALVEAVAARIVLEDRKRDEQTAATRVDFFTMVRGDD